jgi:hypothetical protein
MSLNNKKSKLLRILDIAVGIAVYGGTIASLWWLYKDLKNRGW